MVYNPDDGELLPDGSRIQTTTAGELADWLAEHPPQPCGCADPQPFELCCVITLIPLTRATRSTLRRRKKRRNS